MYKSDDLNIAFYEASKTLAEKYDNPQIIQVFENPDTLQPIVGFSVQDGPIKEVGANGIQIEEVLALAASYIDLAAEKYPSEENKKASEFLNKSISMLLLRKSKREELGVEGTSNN